MAVADATLLAGAPMAFVGGGAAVPMPTAAISPRM